MIKHLLFIFAGGGIGSLLRYFFSSSFNPLFSKFPLGTFLSNVISSFVVGLVVGYFTIKEINEDFYKYFILAGICGGFSTFSGFSNETFALFKAGSYEFALLNIAINVIICIAALWSGMKISSLI
jgi:CrcB protein